jgi:iron complex outermembrane receptor protein
MASCTTSPESVYSRSSKVLLIVALSAAGLLSTRIGWAQSAAASGMGALEEVVVTAQRRAETLQTVPLAVAVFTGESLRQQGLLDLKSLSELTPGLFMGEQKPGQAQWFIRGVGSNDDGATSDQSVPLFIDEQYIPRTAGQVVDLFDLERVEVLRGPQGTLFGRNAAGGAIHLITKKPSETPEARIEATYGNLNAVNLQGFVSGPISGRLLGKLSVSSRRRDGYMESVMAEYPNIASNVNLANLRDARFLNINSDSIRGAVRYLASENLEINVSASYSARQESGTMRYFTPGPGNGGSFYSTDSRLVPDYANNIRKTVMDDPGVAIIGNRLGSLRVDYRLPFGAMLTSLTTYQEGELSQDDVLATPNMARLRLSSNAVATTFIGDNPVNEDNSAFSQELRLTSADDGRLRWVAGLFYLEESVDRDETAGLGIVRSDGSGGLANVVPVTRGGAFQRGRSSSSAVFGQGTYAFTDSLRLTVGARYTRDEKEVSLVGVAGGLVVASSYAGTVSKSWSETTPKVTLDFTPMDDVLLYATAATGFKSGGWQGLAPNAAAAFTPYDPETAELLEIGAKTEWLDKRLRINLSAFQTDYKDMQVVQSLIPENAPPTVTAVVFVTNAASSTIKGAEIEIEAAPTANWFLSGSVALLDTEFQDFVIPPGYRPGIGAPPASNRVGNELRRSPRHTATLLARYTHDLGNGGNIVLQGTYRDIAKTFGDVDNLSFGITPAYSVLDARATYNLPGDQLSMAIWSNNLANEDYFLNNFPNIGSGWAVPAPPRTYGLTVNWRMQ